MRLSALFGCALALLPLLAAPAAAADEPVRRMTVTGTGEVSGRPDMADVTVGVETDAETARAGLDANNAAMTRVMAAMADLGIAEKDLQTSGFSINPRYEQKPNSNEPPRLVGYQVRNQLHVAVRDLDKLGQVLDAAVTQGSNRIDGLAFGFAAPESMLDEARKRAVADARRKAQIYAEGLDLKLGSILSVDEAGGGGPPRPMFARALAAAPAVPIAAGESTLQVQVNVVWQIE